MARGLSEVVDLTTEIHVQSKAKRKAEAAAAVEANEAASKKHKASSSQHVGSASAMILVESYWDSPTKVVKVKTMLTSMQQLPSMVKWARRTCKNHHLL